MGRPVLINDSRFAAKRNRANHLDTIPRIVTTPSKEDAAAERSSPPEGKKKTVNSTSDTSEEVRRNPYPVTIEAFF